MGAELRTRHSARSRAVAWLTLAMQASLAAVVGLAGLRARADNAAFALAPRETTLAFDARRLSEVLVGGRATAVRPVLEALVGAEMLQAFDVLAQRSGTAADRAAAEIFSGRVAFFLDDGDSAAALGETQAEMDRADAGAPERTRGASWVLALEADDSRCERVLRLFGARITEPGRYTAPRERLSMVRLGGWLLVAPSSDAGRASLERAAGRAPREDPHGSLLGEPLVQGLLASDAPVRMFLRHGAPIGGATTVALRETPSTLFADIHGQYDRSPLGAASAAAPLDAHLVRAFEDRAALVVSNPSDGRVGASDLFWTALVPELAPSPAMRSNLAGERIFAVGARATLAAPMLAIAWRVDDAEQALADQDQLMRGVCCGLARALEGGSGMRTGAGESSGSSPLAVGSPSRREGVDEQPAEATRAVARGSAERAPGGATSEEAPVPPLGPGQLALLEMRRCAEYGPFVDRFLGESFKLGGGLLCWSTVATPCGGWQVYASDPTWLGEVSERLAGASCSDSPRPRSAGLGFCDGARAASLLRRWQPLVSARPLPVQGAAVPQDRLAVGIGAVADALERVGRMRFQYATPNERQVHLVVEFESIGALGPGAVRSARPSAPESPR